VPGQDLGDILEVSRETLARLSRYEAMLRHWQKSINLVGRNTLDQVWVRHFQDSAQLAALAPATAKQWLDLGSGAGFPGLVLAILGVGHVHLTESDGRKCVFLREVIRETDAPATVHHGRVETLPPMRADVITARALAPLTALVPLAARHATENTVALFPKGRKSVRELQDLDDWLIESGISMNIEIESLTSRVDGEGAIIRLRGFAP
jgi:16S rRNA (guanine527-N7)-methyltransferase